MNSQLIAILILASVLILGPMAYVFINYLRYKKDYTRLIGQFWLFVILHFISSIVADATGSTYLIGASFSLLIFPIISFTNIIFYTHPNLSLKMSRWVLYQAAATILGTVFYLLTPDDLIPALVSSKFTLLTLPIVIVQCIPAVLIVRFLLNKDTMKMKSEELYRIFIFLYIATNIPNSFFFCFGRLVPEMQTIGYTIALLSFASVSLIVVAMSIMLAALEDSLKSERVKILRSSLLNTIAHDSREGIIGMGEGAEYLIERIKSGQYQSDHFLETLEQIKQEANRVSKTMVKALESERKITMEHILEQEPVGVEYYLAKLEYKLRSAGIDPDVALKSELSPGSVIYTDKDLAFDSVIMNLVTNALRHSSDTNSITFRWFEANDQIGFEVTNLGAISEDTILLAKRGLKPSGRLGLTNFFFMSQTLGIKNEIYAQEGRTIGRAYFNRPRVFHSEVSFQYDSPSHH